MINHASSVHFARSSLRHPPKQMAVPINRPCRTALQRGFLNAQGKTPEATMASALYTDVKKKRGESIFTRCALDVDLDDGLALPLAGV
jgi:hypothetical protein